MTAWNGTGGIFLFIMIPLLACTTDHKVARVGQEIQNLRAFAKLYGYVQYFHPSDEASLIDWDSFAIHGSRSVRSAASTEELKARLEELFLPIAPSVQIYTQGKSPKRQYPDLFPDPMDLKTVTWQHEGHGHGTSGGIYRSRRTHRTRIESGIAYFRLGAQAYQGKTIRFRAAVRADVDGEDNHGHLWVETLTESNEVGFNDDMANRPIISDRWRVFEIEGQLDPDATFVSFGCRLIGQGKLWVDEFELSVESDEGWQRIDFPNLGFEEDVVEGWQFRWERESPGYRHTLTTEHAFSGERCLLLESRSPVDPCLLFPTHATIGEAVESPLASDLICRVPLALYSDETSTLPQADNELFEDLSESLQHIVDDSLGAQDKDLHFADVIIAWNVLQHFYPYFDVVDVEWDTTLTEALQWARDAEDSAEFLQVLRRMVARLKDGHGHVRLTTQQDELAYLPIGVRWIEEQVVVTASADTTRFRVGDIVQSIDDTPAEEAVETKEEYLSGSPHKRRNKALYRFGLGPRGSAAELILNRGNGLIRVTASRELETPPTATQHPLFEEIESGIYYVDLNRIQMPQLSERMAELSKARGVVFDLRFYPAGNDMIITHLTEDPVDSPIWMIPQIIYPDHEGVARYDTTARWTLEPREPLIAGKVVFLTSSDAMSYAETVLGIIEHYQLAEIVGEPTAGTNGNVNRFELPGSLSVTWTGMRVLKHDGSQHHLIGIQPTVPVKRTIASVLEGRDEFLEKAIEVIKEGSRLEGRG